MENLFIEATKYTPKIDLNADSGILNIAGKSYPENTFEFYKSTLTWIEEYFENVSGKKTVVNLDLEYLNSSSLKAYFDIFDILETSHEDGKEIEINWIYDEDNDIAQETGEDFIEDFEELKINLVEKE